MRIGIVKDASFTDEMLAKVKSVLEKEGFEITLINELDMSSSDLKHTSDGVFQFPISFDYLLKLDRLQ